MSTPPSKNKLFGRYNYLMMMVIGFALTGLIGTAAGYYFQSIAQDHHDYHLHEDRATAKINTIKTEFIQRRSLTE